MREDAIDLDALLFGPNVKSPAPPKRPGHGTGGERSRCADHPLILLETLMRDLRHEQAAAFDDLHEWILDLELDNYAAKTCYGYVRAIAPLLRRHPDKAAADFTPADIKQELHYVPPRSRHISRSIYNGWFTWLDQNDKIPSNIMGKVPRIRNPKRRPKDIFSEAEIGLLEGLPSPDGALWCLMFKAGLRRADARHLRRQHVDLNRAKVFIYDGKGGKDAILPLPLAAQTAVADLDLIERLNREDFLWYSMPGGGPRRSRRHPIGDSTFDRWYRRCISMAGVRYLNPHQTRHTYNWWLRDNGFDLEERKVLMRHESIRTTDQDYGRLVPDDVAAKVALL